MRPIVLFAARNIAASSAAARAVGLIIVTLGLGLSSRLVAQQAEAQVVQRPNVLFIAIDDLRPATGSYGDPLAVTPHLDELAARSVQFNRAHCQVAVCNPSRASLMAGRRPDNLGVWTLPIHFREAMPNAVTMPQWFRKFGYTAVAHGKIYHNPTPDPQSWSEAIRPGPRLPSPYPKSVRDETRARDALLPSGDWRKNRLRHPATAAPDVQDHQLLDGARTEMAIEDLRRLGAASKRPDGKPFFLAVGYVRPHLAFIAPKKYWDLHDPAKFTPKIDAVVTPSTPRYALSNNSELSHYADLTDFPKPWADRTVSPEKARLLMHGYYACVSYIDAQVGKLMGALDEAGLADNTIVVLWSDHGWKLGEYRGWGKMSNYEIDTRVPLMISAPGVSQPASQSEDLAELLDLYPTLCELAGLEIPEFVQGTSLVPNLRDPSVRVKSAAYSQYYRRLNGQQFMGYAMRTDTHRFVEWREFETGKVTELELYDHTAGHSETQNIAGSAPAALIDRLTEKLLSSHPRRKLRMTPAIHSKGRSGGAVAKISFSNERSVAVYVYPISSTGRRGKKRTVAPTGDVTIDSYVGAVFVVESADGKTYEVHSPSLPARKVVVK